MFVAPAEVVAATTSPDLEKARGQAANWRSKDMGISEKYLTDDALADLVGAANELEHEQFARSVMAVQSARAGNFQPIPHIDSAAEMFREFLKADMIDGWLYVQEADGYLHPYLVTRIEMEHADRSREARIKITMEADNPTVKRPSRAPECSISKILNSWARLRSMC